MSFFQLHFSAADYDPSVPDLSLDFDARYYIHLSIIPGAITTTIFTFGESSSREDARYFLWDDDRSRVIGIVFPIFCPLLDCGLARKNRRSIFFSFSLFLFSFVFGTTGDAKKSRIASGRAAATVSLNVVPRGWLRAFACTAASLYAK